MKGSRHNPLREHAPAGKEKHFQLMDFPPPTVKQARIVWLSLTGLAIGIIVGLLGLLIWGLGFVLKVLSPVLWPLAIAGILAYLLDPVVDFFERRKVSRQKAIILVFGICVLA